MEMFVTLLNVLSELDPVYWICVAGTIVLLYLVWALSSLRKKMRHPWLYTLEHDLVMEHEVFKGKSFENDWIRIFDGRLTIRAGYSWDGATPKYHLLGLVVWGTPDGIIRNGKPWLYYPTLVHDVFCQWNTEVPLTREEVHGLFKELMEEAEWPLTALYYRAVWLFGPKQFGGD